MISIKSRSTTMCAIIAVAMFLALMVPMVYGDVLPKSSAVPNNQVPGVTTVEVVGIVLEETKRHQTTTSSTSGDGFLTGGLGSSTSTDQYASSTISNGGYYNENKQQVFDAGGVGKGTFNIDSDWVVTYAADPTIGSSLQTTETIRLLVSGTAALDGKKFMNPFIETFANRYIGFDSSYHAGSAISRMTTGAVQRRAEVRSIGNANQIPAELGYDLSVRPDSSSGLMYADGSVSSQFGGTVIDGYGAIGTGYNCVAGSNCTALVDMIGGPNAVVTLEYVPGPQATAGNSFQNPAGGDALVIRSNGNVMETLRTPSTLGAGIGNIYGWNTTTPTSSPFIIALFDSVPALSNLNPPFSGANLLELFRQLDPDKGTFNTWQTGTRTLNVGQFWLTQPGFVLPPVPQSSINFETAASVSGLIFKFDQFYQAVSGVGL